MYSIAQNCIKIIIELYFPININLLLISIMCYDHNHKYIIHQTNITRFVRFNR